MSFQLLVPAPAEGRQASQVSANERTEVQLSQGQSLCLVKIFLNASLGCICFARGLIPHDSPTYSDRRIDDLVLIHLTSSTASYHDFLSFKGQLSPNTESQPFKVLLRGKNKRADHILNLLENGVFEAVENGYLEAVQFSLSRNSSRRQEVIEYYTFSFSYTEFRGNRRQLSSVKVSPAAEDHFHVAGAQKSFRKAIRNLLVLCQELPALPRHRSLGVNLLYNSTCPLVYEPPGFAAAADGNAFPSISTTMGSETIGALQVGSYKVAVAASNAELADKVVVGFSQVPQTIDLTSSRIEDMAVKKQLQAMQRSSSIPSNLVSTQVVHGPEQIYTSYQSAFPAATPPQHGSDVRSQWNSRRQRNVAASKIAELVVQAWALEVHNQSHNYLLDIDQLRNHYKIKRLIPGRGINCECGSDHEEDAMTLCELCGLWQHDICYGLQRHGPQNKPNEHFCYACLLLPRAGPVNNEMPGVVRMRLALTHFYDQNVRVVEKELLMKAVHLATKDEAACWELFAKLEHQGFIRKSSRNGTFDVVKNQKKVADAQFKYLDPFVRISDYYVAVKDKETAQDRTNAIQEALEQYADGRTFDLDDEDPELDEWICTDAFGRQIGRWGFYTAQNKAPSQDESPERISSSTASQEVKASRTGRKMSISKTVVNLDLSSDASGGTETDDLGMSS